MNKTNISWTDYTFNPIIGCSRGCRYCYACDLHTKRHKAYINGSNLPIQYSKSFDNIQFFPERLIQPFKVKKPSKIFICSMGDIFDKNVKQEWIDKIMAVIFLNPRHTFQILTKQPERMEKYINGIEKEFKERIEPHLIKKTNRETNWPLSNLHIGVTVTNSSEWIRRVNILRDCNSYIKFVSMEPMLEDINMFPYLREIDWIILGGQTGKDVVELKYEWVKNVIDQCRNANVSLFFKQWNKSKECLFDGKEIKEFPV